MYDLENPTEPKLSRATGHRYIGKVCPGKKPTRNQWNFETKQFDKVPALYVFCVDCNQWAWGAKSICPNRTVQVKIMTEVYV